MPQPPHPPPLRSPLPPDFAGSAAWPALHVNFDTRIATLFEFTRADYVRAAFLDERALTNRPIRGLEVALADIDQALSEASADRPPLHWLFHIGHCGSTLVSRLLDALPELLGLREPLPLLELAMRSTEPSSPLGRVSQDAFDRDLSLTLDLLQRGFADTRSILIKPTSVVALLGPQLMARSPQSLAIVLSMKLRPWLATMLRDPALRHGMRQQAPVRIDAWHRLTGEHKLRIHALDDAQLMAMSWLAQQLLWRAMRSNGASAGRLLAIDFDDFLADPRSHLFALAKHLGYAVDPFTLAPQRCAELLARYAKDPAQRFDAETRRHEIDTANRRFADEIARGMTWARDALARMGADDMQSALG